VDEYGPVEAVRRLLVGAAPGEVAAGIRPGVGPAVAAADLDDAERLGGRLVGPEDDQWPAAPLRVMAAAAAAGDSVLVPPLALWVRGPARLDQAVAGSIAIVGTRHASSYGCQVAADLAYGLVAAGWVVVAGGGYGIDGAAHRAALRIDAGTTVAVLPGGFGPPYPAGHAVLFDRITVAGLLISPWPPSARPTRVGHLSRARLIAALTAATVVVEATLTTAALQTAAYAHALGRPVLAVPGPVTSALSAGTHQLLRDHRADLVTATADIVTAVRRIP
jgi:DNA processing protein